MRATTTLILGWSLNALAQSPCLTASYPFTNNANDVTGNGHDGTVVGAALAPDRFGNANSCYQFDGINDHIKLAGTWPGTNGTITAWINPETLSQFNPIFSRRDTTMNGNALELVVNSAGGQDDSRLYNGTDQRDCLGGSALYFTNSDPQIQPQVWTYVAMSADDAGIHLFINGSEVSTYGTANPGFWFDDMCPASINTYIGMYSRPINTERFIGRIDDVKVFNCALAPFQVDSLYQAEAFPPTCLLAHYNFDGNANDATGNGHDGTVLGATLAPDRFGNANSCYQFDGINDYIDVSGDWITGASTNGTITAWVHIDDLDDYRPIFWHTCGNCGGDALGLSIDCAACQDVGRLWSVFDDRACGGHLYFNITNNPMPAGVWAHVALVKDDAEVRLYVNCVEMAHYTEAWVDPGLWFGDLCGNAPYTTTIGRAGPEYFKGRIDDLRIYNCALDEAELLALCDMTTAAPVARTETHLGIYPNPTTGSVTITGLPASASTAPWLLVDGTGRTWPLVKGTGFGTHTIELGAYPAGLYLIRVGEVRMTVVKE
ncbi:MAG: hypothetical protein IPP83_00335 [Flavobacteriales bacterium]|nr:hypothetical protein [Flavobacteriales bacterium]